VDFPGLSPGSGPWWLFALGPGARPIGTNATIGALRSGLAIGEVQVLLNPHVGSGERGVSPCSPGQWTVVAITAGVGAGEGASPLPARDKTHEAPVPERGSAW